MMRTRMRCIVFTVVCIGLLAAGCSRVELYKNLSEEDANEILVLLAENGVKAKKKEIVRQNEITYAIEVPEDEMVRARSLLVKHSLPRRKELGLTGVYKEKGLIPTPDEQKARYLLAIKGEIINSLERLPSIIDADVVLNVPTKDEFAGAEAQKRQRPTASVVVRAKPGAFGDDAITEPKIQQFVANAVEGMNPRDVTVILSYIPVEEGEGDAVRRRGSDVPFAPAVDVTPSRAPGLPPAAMETTPGVKHEIIGLTLDAGSKERLKLYLLIFFVVLVILSVALIIVIVQGARMRRTLAALSRPAGEHPAIEGELLEEGPPQIGEGEGGGPIPPEEF